MGLREDLYASSEPSVPHACFSVSFSMCEMVQGATGRRGQGLGVHCTGTPGNIPVPTQPWQPVAASRSRCTRWGSPRAPSARGTRPLGDPGHWDRCCICRSAAPSSQVVMGCFQHRQRSIGWAQGRAATLCRYGHAQGSVPPLPPQRCPGSGCVAVSVVAGPPELCILPSAAAGWMPGQTDDGPILPGGFCAIRGKHCKRACADYLSCLQDCALQ